MKTAIGIALVALHALLFALAIDRCRGTELSIELPAGRVPPALVDRVTVDDTPGPGLVRRRWTMRYRGGIERSVGAVQLIGPTQDPAGHACVGRVVIGQRLLDSTVAGTIRAEMQKQLEAELSGESIFPIGDYQRIEHLELAWAEPARHPEDLFVGAAPFGYVRASARIVFQRVDVPIVVAFVPELATTELHFRIAARAELAFDNRAVQWVSDKLGGDSLATRLARRQIDETLITTLAPPPPFTLSGGQTIRFTYCHEPIEIREHAYAALPFGIAIARDERAPHVLPPRFGHGPRAAPPPSTAVALDLDLDALNALLYELWRGGFLDRQLADAGLDRRFNTDPTVIEFLTIRLSPLHLALPPVVTANAHGLRLGAEARAEIDDRGQRTTGRIWGAIDFSFTSAEHAAVDLGELELSCERTPTVLVPCYGDLVGALRGRAADFHGALTQTFAKLVSDIFVGRIAVWLPADLVIRTATPSVMLTSGNATLHLELEAAIAPTK